MFGLNYSLSKKVSLEKEKPFYSIIAILRDNLVHRKRKHMVHNREVPNNQI